MGNAASSELDATVRKLEDLKNKPDQLKMELRKFVAQLPLDHTVDVRADKKLFDIMMGLVTYELKREGSPDLPVIMAALQRLLRIRGFYSAAPRCSIVPLIQSLQMRDPKNVLVTLQAIASLLDCRCPSDKKFDKSMAELSAKQAFFESQGYDVLVKRVLIPYGRTQHAAVLAKVLDILALDLVDNCITTRFVGIQKLLSLLSPHVDLLLTLTTHTDLNTRCYASILLQGYLLHSSLQTTQNLQSKVLEEGHLLYYVLFAIDGANLPAQHPYTKNWYDKNLTELSRNLLGLLCAGNPGIIEVCIQKTIPKPLQLSMAAIGADSVSNAALSQRNKSDKDQIKNTLWNNFQSGRMKRVRLHPQFAALDNEVREPHVLWTLTTKAELCVGLLSEINDLAKQKEINPHSRWDYEGWEINYKSLDRYLRVGGFYISLLLPVLQDKHSSYVIELERIHMLLAALFQRSVTEDDAGWKLACLRTMTALYEKYGDQLTRDLEIIPYFAWLIDPRHVHILPIIRDHILTLLQTLLKDGGNVRRFVKAGGVQHLLYYISRVLCIKDPLQEKEAAVKAKIARKKKKAAADSEDEEEEEEEKAEEPVSPSAAAASGEDESSKQNLLGGLPLPLGIPETAMLCLGLLRQIQMAGAKMRRVMSEKDVVSTLIRLLMSPIAGVKEDGIKLLLEVLEHSTHLVPRLITTGMFSFLVYGLRYGTSPAVLELLGKYHLKQDKSIVPAGESALTPYFPRALADVLKSQGADAFGQLFESRDGASSNAVAAGSDLIWNPQLKKHLLEVMSRRLGSFRALLEKDPLAEFKFSPPEPIRYPSLESELDMAGVSLRALNETGGVADLMSAISIPDPEELMAELVRALNARRYAGIDLLTILTSQVILIRRFPSLSDVQHYSGWEALYEILSTHAEADFPMIEKSAEIIHVLLSAKPLPKNADEEGDDEEEEVTNTSTFLANKGVTTLVRTLEYFSSLKVNNVLIQRILIDLLNCVYDIGVSAPDAVAKELSTHRKLVRRLILDFLGNKVSQSHPMLSVVTCKCLMALSLNDKFQLILLETGTLLHLVDMACFYRSTASEQDSANAASQKGIDEERRVRLAASSVLSLLAGFTTPALKPEPNAQLQRVLSALLTADLMQSLSSPSAFVTRVTEFRPQLQVLYKYIESELLLATKIGEWPAKNWPFQPLNINLRPNAPKRHAQHNAFQTPNGHAATAADDYEHEEEQEQYEDDDQTADDDTAGELPDAYSASVPQHRLMTPSQKMEAKLEGLTDSLEGAFGSFSRKAASALTPVRVSLAASAKSAQSAMKSAAASVSQNEKVQAGTQQVKAGAKQVAAAAAPKIAAAKQAAAPAVAAVKQAAAPAVAAAKEGANVAAGAAKHAAASAAPKVAAAKQAAAPKIAAAGAAVSGAASSALASAKSTAQALHDAAASTHADEEEVHTSAEFYANAQGDLLSPNVKSPSTQHTPFAPAAVADASPSPHLDEYESHGASTDYSDPYSYENDGFANGAHQQQMEQQQHAQQSTDEYTDDTAAYNGSSADQQQYDDYSGGSAEYADVGAYDDGAGGASVTGGAPGGVDEENVPEVAPITSPSGRVILSSR